MMSYTKRAIEKALYAPHELTPAERAFTRGIQPEWHDIEAPMDPPDDRDAGSPDPDLTPGVDFCPSCGFPAAHYRDGVCEQCYIENQE